MSDEVRVRIDGAGFLGKPTLTSERSGKVVTILADGVPFATLNDGEKGDSGDKGDKGDKGDSGVYVGSGTPPEGTNVQVDPNGEALEVITRDEYDPDEKTSRMTHAVGVDENGKLYAENGKTADVWFLHGDTSEMAHDYGLGMCGVLWDGETCIVNDFGYDNGATLATFLAGKGIDHIDAVIASHYHSDHCSKDAIDNLLGEMFSGISLEGCTFYLPHKNIVWDSFVWGSMDRYDDVEEYIIAALTGRNIVQPEIEGHSYPHGNFGLQFYNVDSSLYDDYYSYQLNEALNNNGHTNYNNFSMGAMVTFAGKTKMLLPGDWEYPAEKKMKDLAKEADVIVVPHHGLNCAEPKEFFDGIKANVSVVPSFYDSRELVVKYGLRPVTARCNEVGTVVSTLDTDVCVKLLEGGAYVSADEHNAVRGEAVGQMLFDNPNDDNPYADDLNNIDLGVYYTQNASRCIGIGNYPVIDGVRNAGKICCLPSSNTASATNGRIQIFCSTYWEDVRVAFRKLDSAHGGWSLWKQIPNMDDVNDAIRDAANYNMLDNWCFIDPVNQRGQTSYSGTGYGIDRWRVNFGGDTVELDGESVKNTIVSATKGWHLHQDVEIEPDVVGKTVTVSFLVKAFVGSKIKAYASFRDASGDEISSKNVELATGLISASGVVPTGTVKIRVGLYASDGAASGDYVQLIAAKLELGSYQTLAYKKGDAWELYKHSDYAEHLLRCQRYYIPYDEEIVLSGYTSDDGSEAYCQMVYPVSPAHSMVCYPASVTVISDTGAATGTVETAQSALGAVVGNRQTLTITGLTLTPDRPVIAKFDSGVSFSCEP